MPGVLFTKEHVEQTLLIY